MDYILYTLALIMTIAWLFNFLQPQKSDDASMNISNQKVTCAQWFRKLEEAINMGRIEIGSIDVLNLELIKIDNFTHDVFEQFGSLDIPQGGLSLGSQFFSLNPKGLPSGYIIIGQSEEDMLFFAVNPNSSEIVSFQMGSKNPIVLDRYENVAELALDYAQE